MSLVGLTARTKTVNELRSQLALRGFSEFIPQLLAPAQPTEPAIFPFKAGNFYLATSPESFLKQAMAAGAGNCFAISHCFRALEQENYLHQPDFLMCEFYIKNANYTHIMDLTNEIVNNLLKITKTYKKLSILNLWQNYLSVDLRTLNLFDFAKNHGFDTDNATWEQLFYQIHFNEIEPHYPTEPFFLIDFPAQISPLCKPKDDDPFVAERFELIINKIEIADGNTENFDYLTIKKMMQDECTKRNLSLDKKFINALKKLNGQNWAGVGFGVDRLAMLQNNISDIKSLIEV